MPILTVIEGISTMASLKDAGDWMGEHPYATGAIIFGGGLALLWMFGYLGGGGSQQAAAPNNAAAFYAAEAASTQAGAAIQLGTLQTQAQTAQAKLQADAAVAINESNNGAAMTINQQNTGSANTIAGLSLLGTQSNNDATTAQVNNNNYYAYVTAKSHDDATLASTALTGIIPQELAMGQGFGNFFLPNGQTISVNTGAPTSINTLIGMGYSPAQAQMLARV